MNNTKLHSECIAAIRLDLGREGDFKLWPNSRVTIVGGVPRASPGLCKGASDLIGILGPSGRLCALEMKTGHGVLTKEQRMFQQLIREMGGFACVIHADDIEQAKLNAREAIGRARLGQSE